MTIAPDPTRCPHLARRFSLDAGIVWFCVTCHTTGRADSWKSYDAAAGCSDWERGRCGHERCRELRETVRSEGR